MVLSYLVLVTCAYVVYLLGLVIYRLYFHPLARFPGSKIAALSLWPEFYYDVIKRGQFMWQLREMHDRYGPIVRINPNEIHIDDPDYYDEIYGSSTRKRDKYAPWVVTSGTPGACFATVEHDHHRLRRGPLNPFFSKKAVTQLEPVVKAKVEKLASRLSDAAKTGCVVRSDAAYTALTMDIICQYAFAADDDMLMEEDFNLAWKETLAGSFEGGALLRQYPWLLTLMNAMPDALIKKGVPSVKLMYDWKAGVRRRITPILNFTEKQSDIENASHRTIFHELRDSNLAPKEKTIGRLCDEGQILTGAGSETTAHALATTTFHLLDNKEKLAKLKRELSIAIPNARDNVLWSHLEQLPYLSAVISEGLRLSHGPTVRLPRVATQETLRYKDWEIPFGTPVSSSGYFILMNPKIFPEPEKFLPERWLLGDGTEYNHGLAQRYLVNFGRGSRQCLGMNLAYAELYLTIATIFRRLEMELHETSVEDVKMAHDFFTAFPRLDSKGVRIVVTGEMNV